MNLFVNPINSFSFRNSIQTFTLIFVVLISTSCSNLKVKKAFTQLENGQIEPKGIKITYPQHGTVLPPEFPALTFEWKDSTKGSENYSLFVSDTLGNILISSKSITTSWRPDSASWENIKKASITKSFNFTVIAEKGNNKFNPACRIRFSFTKDSVGADIFFRAVTLPFSYAVKNVHTIEWYLGSVNGRKPRKMLDNLPVCGNCHSFANSEPLLAMDVDYGDDKGSYVITEATDTAMLKPKNIITWSDYKREDNDPTFGLLSQISPDGNYVVSTVKDLSIFVAVDDNLAYSQLFFPIKGIIGIYDRKNNSFGALNGANDQKYVQSNPTWSPDSKKVVFARTTAYVNEKVRLAGKALLSIDDVAEFSKGGKQFKYDLYAVDFNNGKGGIATPIEGASFNGKSNYFPKFSPDGKWIVFCQAENYMLLQPDSRLYIIPSNGGTPRLMNCNMVEMNSWHSWSPNGRWLVFSSKNKGLYTQLYLTHIDEIGMDSPPILLENLSFEKRAANIPEFYPFDADQFKLIKDDFSNTAEYFNHGAYDKITYKFYKRANDDLKKAMEIDSNYLETYFNRILLNNILKQSNSKDDLAIKKKAMKLVLDSIAQNPNNENYLSLEISLLSSMGNKEEALKKAKIAINKYPNNYKIYDLLCSIYRSEGQFEKAIECYSMMLKIDANKKLLLNNLIAEAYMNLNQNEKALQIINQLINKYPNNNDLVFTRAQIMYNNKKINPATIDIEFLLTKDSTNIKYNQFLTQCYLDMGNKQLYMKQKRKTLDILNELYYKNSEDIELVFEMANVYISLNDMVNAEEKYNLILNNFPTNYEALKQKAIIKLNTKQWLDAISIYDQLENNYQLEEGFCNNKAIAFIQIGNYSKALEYFDKTIELNPNNKDAIFNRNKLMKETAHY